MRESSEPDIARPAEQDPDTLHSRGVVAYQSGHTELAERLIRSAIKIKPSEATYHNNLGNVLVRLKRHDEAQECYREAIRLNPNYADAHYNLGLLHYCRRNLQASSDSLRRAVECNQSLWEAWNNLGLVLQELKNYKASVFSLKIAAQLAPSSTEVLLNLGSVLQKIGDFTEAKATVERVLKLKPNSAEAWNLLGVLLDGMDNLHSAQCFRSALKHRPDYPEALSNLGRTLSLTGAEEEGIALLRKAIELSPNYADAHWNLALALLLHGEYPEGWREHEWRWKIDSHRSPLRNFSQPQWRGEKLTGKRLLLHAEQGFGDTIQFARYIPKAAEASGAEIIFEVREPLHRLLAGIPGVSQTVVYGDPLPEFDAHCPLMSLPLVFGTTLDNIPVPVVLPSLVDTFAGSTSVKNKSLQVGLAWAGSPDHGFDRRRSIPLSTLLPLKNIPNISYFSVFKGPALAEISSLRDQFPITDLCSKAEDFFDTTKEIAKLDLIVSVDTAIAHLAATMGKPVWLLLPYTPDWRWLSQRTDSPWYPSIRIFRQDALGDWSKVMQQVIQELSALSKSRAEK